MDEHRAQRDTAENRAARILLGEHEALAVDAAWQAVLDSQPDKRLRERMEKVGWEHWKISIAKQLDLPRFNALTRDPGTPKPEQTTLF